MPNLLSRPVRSPVSVSLLAALVLVIVLVLIAARLDRGVPPANAVFAYEVPGAVFNRLTGERLAGARLDCAGATATSDLVGRFTLSLGPGEVQRCGVTATGFESQFVDARSAARLGVWLTPDPIWTVRQVIEWEKDREFGRQYDVLHPDVRRSWTREEYSRLMGLTQNRQILAVEQQAVEYLPSWSNYGDVYYGVALVPTWITYQEGGREERALWQAHLVKVDGVWRWFREPGA
jgi:hypothetical protein